MDYNVISERCIQLNNIKNFDLTQIFTCGQCFRWFPQSDTSFTGIAFGKVINVAKNGEDIIIDNCTESDFLNIWSDYFDLKRDYSEIIRNLSNDNILKTAVSYGNGIRILKQDFFECLLSFIISANNNIPRIQGIIDRLSSMYGKSVTYNGKEYFSFPEPEALRGITETDLAPLRSGYRAKYLVNAVNSYLNGEINADSINKTMPIPEARRALCQISGVGPKVADCILLFSLGRFDAFPTDVWVKRVMSELYGCDEKDAAKTGFELFGDNAGIAQQYLFFWRRAQ